MDEFYSDAYTDPLKPYSHREPFIKVLALHEEKKTLDWNELSEQIPLLSRGWFELSRLDAQDRIEFTRDFWLSKIPFVSHNDEEIEKRLLNFFDCVENIGIYATQIGVNIPFEIHMIYELKDEKGYFNASPPATAKNISHFQKQFGNIYFPQDYLNFLQIHDGFCKYTDTGLIKIRDMSKTYLKFQKILEDEAILTPLGEVLNPSSLIPFYESYGLHCYQCFLKDWCPIEEMGNVYFSESERIISDYHDVHRLEENLAFPTFLDWLLNYLEEQG